MGLRVGIRRVNVRFDPNMGENGTFLMRCDTCATLGAGGSAYWPMTTEYWDPGQGLQRCWACHRAERRRKHHARMLRDPEFMRARWRRYYATSRDRVLAHRRKVYAENREAILEQRRIKYAEGRTT